MWKGYYGVFSDISDTNIITTTRTKKQGLIKTLNITVIMISVSTYLNKI